MDRQRRKEMLELEGEEGEGGFATRSWIAVEDQSALE